jgi:hypothetical protein
MTWKEILKIWEGKIVEDQGKGLYIELDSGKRYALSMDPRDDLKVTDPRELWEKSRVLYSDYIGMGIKIRGYREGDTIFAAMVVDNR